MSSLCVTSLLSELVACPSVNPRRQVPTASPYGEERLQNLLAERLSAWGAKTEMQPVEEGRYNLIARFRGVDSHRSLMFEVHADTVQADDMTIPPFEPRVENGCLYGRGSCDDKGPMAAMLAAIKTVLDEDGLPPVDLYFVSTCDEELGANGAHALVQSGFKTDFAIVGEPTELSIIHAHKGALRWKIETRGVPAHSSTPEQGVNAIYKMRHVLERFERVMIPALQGREHPLLGAPTLSVGTIAGGSQVNVVPGNCVIEVDRRTIPGETEKALTEEVVQQLDQMKKEDADFDYTLEPIEWYPSFEEPTNSRVAAFVESVCTETLGASRFCVAPWAANSGVFKLAGIPCVLFGPGSVKQAHTREEFIEIDQVKKAVGVYASLIRRSAELVP